MSYFFHEAASAEQLEYAAYYESCQVGLGARYLSAFDEAMDKVCQYPDRYRVEFPPNIRKFCIPSFPYNILYRLVGSTVEVWLSHPIADDQGTGLAGFNWLINASFAGHPPQLKITMSRALAVA